MTVNQLKTLIQNGETETVEFKQSFNKSVIETLVAFSNTRGGKVLVGVKNDKTIVGVFITEEAVQKWVNEVKQNSEPSIIPDVDIINIKDKTVVIFKVSEFPVKPVSFKGRFYIRKQNANHQLNARGISDIYLYSMQYSWDAYPFRDATLNDIDESLVQKFIGKVNVIKRFELPENAIDALNKLKLIKNGKPTNAAIILFNNDIFSYNVHIGRFKTNSLIIADDIISGDLYTVLEKAMNKIISHLKFAFEITGETTQRKEIPEYPLEALRELLVNALVHRDYTDSGDVQIKIFDNKITFYNPGKLYGGLTVKDLATDDYQARTRNKLIAEALYLTKDIEKYGSGFIRIRDYIADYPTMKFDYKEISGGFLAGLYYTKQKTSTKDVGKDVGKDLTDLQKSILKLVELNHKITIPIIAKKLNTTTRTVERNIEKLKKTDIIKRVGGRKDGYWQIVKQD